MPLALRRLFWLCACLLPLGVAGAQTPSFNTVVVFGDSLSDTGNIANLVQHANPLGVRYPSDNPLFGFDYTDGRFTDGADTQPAAGAYFGVWVEQLAASLPGKPAVKDSLDGGTNYAYGDATTGGGTTTESDSVDGITVTISLHNMGQQVTDYLDDVASKAASAPSANTLFVLWGGANDLYQASTAGNDPVAAAGTAVANEVALVQRLVSAGATNFMIPNLPPLGGVPEYATGAGATALNTASAAFAQELPVALASLKMTLAAQGVTINLYQPDIFDLFANFAANPMAVGLGNVTAKAQGISGSPDPYLIWDGLHPTTTGHHFAAATAANLLTPLVASSTAFTVPAAVLPGTPVNVSATVTSTASSAVPTGLVTFFSGTTYVASAVLNASGTGSATFTPPASATPLSLTAVYAGDTTYNPSSSAAQPLTELTAAVGTTTSLTSSVGSSVATGSSVTLTATVVPAVGTYGPATGSVAFLSGTTTLGTGTLANGVATLTTTALPAGTDSLTAVYAGAGVFGGSTSAAVTETVAAPGFTATLNPTSITIASGASGSTMLSASDVGGFTGAVTPSCGTLPAGMTCSFGGSATNTAVPAGQMEWTLTIATNGTATAALQLPRRPGSWQAPAVFSATSLLAATLLLGFRRRLGTSLGMRSRGLWLTTLAVLLLGGGVLGLSGCGSSNSNNTPAGTYTVPVILTPPSGSSVAAQTVNLSVTVQ